MMEEKYFSMGSNLDVSSINQKQNDSDFYGDFFFALTSPSGLLAAGWLVCSFLAVLYGTSIVICLSFCFPLIMVPYIINQEMHVQYLPALRKKSTKLRVQANTLAMENVQLKNVESRMQRQVYRLSVVEERFEYICKTGDKDITKMKKMAKKNAVLQQRIKSNLATNRIQTLITAMLQSDGKGNCLIRETEIDEVVSNVMDLAGRNSWKVKRDDIWEGFVKSVTKNNSATLIKTADNDSKFELRRRTEDEGEELRTKEVKEEKTPDSQKIQPITRLSDAQDTRKVASHTMQPNAPLFTKRNMTVTNNNNVHGIIAAPSNGTADSPIDIDSILFNDQSTADPIHSE